MNFRKSYLVATAITALFAVLALRDGFNIYALIVLVLLGLPLILPLSIRSKQWLAFIISLTFVVLSTLFLINCWVMFSEAESLSDFEGPNGEGAPIAPVIGVFMFGIFFMIPWSIASLRCYRHIKEQAEQVGAPNPLPAE